MIKYKIGNLFDNLEPYTDIIQVVNDIGAWGKGFVVPLGQKYPNTKKTYLSWAAQYKNNLPQGEVLYTFEADHITVLNCVAQKGIYGEKPFRPESLETCFQFIAADYAFESEFSGYIQPKIVMPRIGCGLAKGSWTLEVEPLINKYFAELDVTVFTLPHEAAQFGMVI
jgi:hypothetical protein